MPAMAGMSMQPPKVNPGAAPGTHVVAVRFPHAGAYRLDLRVTPPGEPPARVSFELSAAESMGAPDHHGEHDMGMMHMMPAFAGIPETREASGTSWQPDSAPMHAAHLMAGPWMLMQHYSIFLNYDNQSGPRGDDQFNST